MKRMPFNSLTYFLFLPVVYILFNIVGDRYRRHVLLLSSVAFYAALKVPYLVITLAAVAAVTYLFGVCLGRTDNVDYRKRLLWGGIGLNLLVLCSLKYLPPFIMGLNGLLSGSNIDTYLHIIPMFVSIGVSYYVFQAISYLIDIYLEIEEPEQDFCTFALYLSFFPKLLQGPIERAGDLLPQLKAKYEFNYENMRTGLLLFTWGLFKKVAIADRLAFFVNRAFENPHEFTGLPLIMSTYLYAIQIYCDFSGYTDMALGAARLFNINLTQNFNNPYMATSIADFWRRWHISFSRWILDYIFKPLQLGWRDYKNAGTAAALLVTFIISGIWHGANWGFVIWGLLHGIYLASSIYYKPVKQKIHKMLKFPLLTKIIQITITFNLVCFAWIFFRASKVTDALYIVTHLFAGSHTMKAYLDNSRSELALVFMLIVFLIVSSQMINSVRIVQWFYKSNIFVRWPVYICLVLLTIILNVNADKVFIYFQF